METYVFRSSYVHGVPRPPPPQAPPLILPGWTGAITCTLSFIRDQGETPLHIPPYNLRPKRLGGYERSIAQLLPVLGRGGDKCGAPGSQPVVRFYDLPLCIVDGTIEIKFNAEKFLAFLLLLLAEGRSGGEYH